MVYRGSSYLGLHVFPFDPVLTQTDGGGSRARPAGTAAPKSTSCVPGVPASMGTLIAARGCKYPPFRCPWMLGIPRQPKVCPLSFCTAGAQADITY